MDFALATSAAAAGYRLAVHDTIDSTSSEAMSRAAAGEAGPLWVVAAHQSEGRGRRGSAWHTPRGNLAASLLLSLDLAPATIATLGFVAGVALARALDVCCGLGASPSEAGLGPAPRDEEGGGLLFAEPPHAEVPRSSLEAHPPFCLKWPNDVMAHGAKLAGILLQTEEIGARRAVVVGIGVNVVATPDGLPYPATSLAALGCRTGAPLLFGALSAAWTDVMDVWDDGCGFDRIRELWLARAAGLGGSVAVRSGGGTREGVFETIDDQGHLVMRARDGATHRVSAGEVHFGRAGSLRAEASA